MSFKLLFTLLLTLLVSTVEALTLKVSFPQNKPPAQLNFAYAISSGNCSNPNNVKCHFTQSSVSGLQGAHIIQYITVLNAEFKAMTPVVDKFHKPTNFIKMTIPGQKGTCLINIVGKTNISVLLNQNGSCV